MNLDPELQLFQHFTMPDFADVGGVRKWLVEFAASAPPLDPALSEGLEIWDEATDAYSGGPGVKLRIYKPKIASPSPALVYFHGGSFLMGNLDTDHVSCLKYAREAACTVISVDYRLAPENRFPAGFEDGYAAWLWVHAHAEKYQIDPARIAVGGSSAGGCMAAAIAIAARDRLGPQPALQMLVYPALDDRMETASLNSGAPVCGLPRSVVGHMWRHYLGNDGVATSPYAAPARVTDISGLAAAYIETCELDPLRDEVIDYAKRLLQGGVSVDFHICSPAPRTVSIAY